MNWLLELDTCVNRDKNESFTHNLLACNNNCPARHYWHNYLDIIRGAKTLKAQEQVLGTLIIV